MSTGCHRLCRCRTQAECATKVWQNTDQGIWEAHGEPSTMRPRSSCAGRARPGGGGGDRGAGATGVVGGDADGSTTSSSTVSTNGASCVATRPMRSMPRSCSLPSSGSPRRRRRLHATVGRSRRPRTARPHIPGSDRRRALRQGGPPHLLIPGSCPRSTSSARCSAPACGAAPAHRLAVRALRQVRRRRSASRQRGFSHLALIGAPILVPELLEGSEPPSLERQATT
jgi:hypothetical protein